MNFLTYFFWLHMKLNLISTKFLPPYFFSNYVDYSESILISHKYALYNFYAYMSDLTESSYNSRKDNLVV